MLTKEGIHQIEKVEVGHGRVEVASQREHCVQRFEGVQGLGVFSPSPNHHHHHHPSHIINYVFFVRKALFKQNIFNL